MKFDEPVCTIQANDNRAPRVIMRSGAVWRLTGDGVWKADSPIPGTAAALFEPNGDVHQCDAPETVMCTSAFGRDVICCGSETCKSGKHICLSCKGPECFQREKADLEEALVGLIEYCQE